jgi:hypothetical protein
MWSDGWDGAVGMGAVHAPRVPEPLGRRRHGPRRLRAVSVESVVSGAQGYMTKQETGKAHDSGPSTAARSRERFPVQSEHGATAGAEASAKQTQFVRTAFVITG